MEKRAPVISQLFTVLKRKLKAKGLTYRDIAYAVNATEVSVRRWFSEERLGIEQLSVIVDLLGLTLTELLQEAEEPPLVQFTPEQEAALTADLRLLTMLRLVMCNLNVKEIVANFKFTEVECIDYLTALDRMRIIDLLPGNQIRVRIARDADLLPNGPLKRFFLHDLMPEYLLSDFNGKYEDLLIMRACLSADAIKQFKVYVRRLKRQLAELHEESFSVPFEQRHGFTAVLMHRDWEPDEFISLRREPTDQ